MAHSLPGIGITASFATESAKSNGTATTVQGIIAAETDRRAFGQPYYLIDQINAGNGSF
jgi:hypothetical protein